MTTYYVDATGGSDSNAGTSAGSPWQTVSKVNTEWNAGTFSAGDSILFKRGGTWNVSGGGLYPKNGSGTDGNPIYIGAYGSGADPVLDHQAVNGSCVYRNNGDAAADYVHFQNITFRRAQQAAGMKIYDATGWIVQDCTFEDITRDSGAGSPWCAGIQLRWTDGVVIRDCVFDNIGGEAIYGGESGVVTTTCDNTLVIGCTFTDIDDEIVDWKGGCDHNVIAFCSASGSTGWGPRLGNIGGRENIIYGCDWDCNGEDGFQISTGSLAAGVYGHLVLRCIFRNADVFAVRLSANSNHVRDCVFLDNPTAVIVNEWYDAGADHVMRFNHFRGNTVDVQRDTSRLDCDGSRYYDTCQWYQGGANRTLSYVQGTLGHEGNASENDGTLQSAWWLDEEYEDASNLVQVQTWHDGDCPVAILAASPTLVKALWWSDLSGMTESQMNTALAAWVADFPGLSAQMESGSTTNIVATW